MMHRRLQGLSLFAGAGIGETYLSESGIDIVVANELLPKRADLYRKLNPSTNIICGDITDEAIFNEIIESSKGIDFIIASPPCQGMSVAGKNRKQEHFVKDKRNYLITYVLKAIAILEPSYILIENVPALLDVKLEYNNKQTSVIDMLSLEFNEQYEIESKILDAADYGVPQTRLRAIIKMNKKNQQWSFPTKVLKKITVEEAIGFLPSLESGEHSDIKWHYARNHTAENVLWMKHTPTGKSAFNNKEFFPKKKDGTPIKGYESSYRRIRWDAPAPTITIRNDCIASQRNVHPGRLQEDGTYSDARVLTPLELMILNSLPTDWNIPDNTSEILIRQCLGESIPPLLIKRIAEGIQDE
ncbi:MAG: DNA cytosine methyltransferase [Ruminococcus sp.]|jgi:DNA (cytosine-5)-methyltransferase 1|nr:DNA cytosine methyltransferase [Ruminococcus sp.]